MGAINTSANTMEVQNVLGLKNGKMYEQRRKAVKCQDLQM